MNRKSVRVSGTSMQVSTYSWGSQGTARSGGFRSGLALFLGNERQAHVLRMERQGRSQSLKRRVLATCDFPANQPRPPGFM